MLAFAFHPHHYERVSKLQLASVKNLRTREPEGSIVNLVSERRNFASAKSGAQFSWLHRSFAAKRMVEIKQTMFAQ